MMRLFIRLGWCGVLVLSMWVQGQADPNRFDFENAADWYRKAIALYTEPEGFELKDYLDGDIELTEEIERYLESQQPVIELLERAAQVERCDWKHDRFEDIWSHHNDYAYECRQCVRVLLADTKSKEADLPFSNILERCQIALQAADHVDAADPWNHSIAVAIRISCVDYLFHYVNHQSELTAQELKALVHLLKERYDKRSITLNQVLLGELQFAETALKETGNLRAKINDPIIEKILTFNEANGKKEFFQSCLNFYRNYISQLQVAANLPIAMRALSIQLIEEDLFEKCEVVMEKYEPLLESVPDDFAPSQDDYDDLIQKGGYMFTLCNEPMAGIILYFESGADTQRNALLIGLGLLADYRQTGRLAEALGPGSPTDAFGEQPFELLRTETGFTLKSRSMNVRSKEFPEYAFTLPERGRGD